MTTPTVQGARPRWRVVISGMRVTLQRLDTPDSPRFEGELSFAGDVTWRVSGNGDGRCGDGVGTSIPPPPHTTTSPFVTVKDPPDLAVASNGSSASRPPAKLAVLVPFREDGTGREAQLSALLARLGLMFSADELCVVVAEQSNDNRKFNRGQLLNCAFACVLSKKWCDENTLFCFHDCDMLPDLELAGQYLRPSPVCGRGDGDTGDNDKNQKNGFVRVLCAEDGRYDVDACFGGVTIYNKKGFEQTNGYPNAFWGWGGEDNCQFKRCAVQNLWMERVRDARFEDLEGLSTVAEKLDRLNVLQARCPAKEKKKLLSENTRNWRLDGLCSVAYDAAEVNMGDAENETETETKTVTNSTNSIRRFVRVVFTLRAGIRDEIVCSTCGIKKSPAGFASHQHKRAMFFAKRDRVPKPRDVEKEEKNNESRKQVTEKEVFWRQENRQRSLCHWDERGDHGDSSKLSGVQKSAGDTQSSSAEENMVSMETASTSLETESGPALEDDEQKSEKAVREKNEKAAARCLACVAKDPRVELFRKQAEVNATDVTRVTCVRCGAKFDKRNKLFEHLKQTSCGIQDGEVIEGHARTRL